MFIIRKEFHFSASHQLDHLPVEHPCRRMHGHNYVIIVELRSKTTNMNGFVKDYNDLEPIKEYIDRNLDHRHLNNVFLCKPTAELMAEQLFSTFQLLVGQEFLYAVEVCETPKTSARYEHSNN